MTVTESEMRAIEILYAKKHGEALGYADIPEDEIGPFLTEIRDRVAKIEQHATHDMLMGKLREDRWTPRRPMIAAFGALVVLTLIVALGLGIGHMLGLK